MSLSLKKSLDVAEQIGHRFYRGLALMYLGRLKTAQGLYPQAEALLAESIRIVDELQAQDSLVDALYYLAENYISQGDLLQAEKWIGRSLEILNSIHRSPSEDSVIYGKMLRLQGIIARTKGDFDKAEKLLMESTLIFQTSYERLEIAKTEVELGLLAKEQGNLLESRRRLQEARLMFKQMGALQHLGQVEDILQHLSS
jgi:tetratricopeptide (TPR) repeat protein